MLFVWLLIRPIWNAIGGPLLIVAGLLLLGQAAGFPVAGTIVSAIIDGAVAMFTWFWSTIIDWLASRVVDRVNPFSIAFRTPVAAG